MSVSEGRLTLSDRERDDLPLDLYHQLPELEDKLISRVEQLLQDGPPREPSASTERPSPTAGLDDPIRLTEREAQILRLLVAGRTNRQIGAQLRVGPSTIRNHLTRTYQKLGVMTRTQAAVRALELGLSRADPSAAS